MFFFLLLFLFVVVVVVVFVDIAVVVIIVVVILYHWPTSPCFFSLLDMISKVFCVTFASKSLFGCILNRLCLSIHLSVGNQLVKNQLKFMKLHEIT